MSYFNVAETNKNLIPMLTIFTGDSVDVLKKELLWDCMNDIRKIHRNIKWVVNTTGDRFMDHEGPVIILDTLLDALSYCFDKVVLAKLSSADLGFDETWTKSADVKWTVDVAKSIYGCIADQHVTLCAVFSIQ